LSDIPQAGNKLTMTDVDQIAEAVKTRRNNFPDEPIEMTVALILFNIGDRYATATCINGEWSGFKQDIPKGDDNSIPTCPNGHVMTQGPGLMLGWYLDD